MAQLSISKDGNDIKLYSIQKKLISLGRALICDVVLTDSDVSSLHANIICDAENEHRLIDQGSTNGTFVNGKRIKEYDLTDGDTFRIGRYIIKFISKNDFDKTEVMVLDQDFIAQSRTLLSEIKGSQLPQLLEKTQNIEASRVLVKSLENLDLSLVSACTAQEQLKTLLHIAEVINSARGLDTVLSVILDSALNATGMARGSVMLYDEEKHLYPAVSVGLENDGSDDKNRIVSESVINKALVSGEPVVLSDMDDALEFKNAQSIVSQNIKATVVLPLKSRTGKLIGALYMDNCLASVNKSNISPDFLRMFGIFAATAIQTHQMAHHEKKISEELAVAREREKFQEQLKALEKENKILVKKSGVSRFENFLGTSQEMQKLYGFIEKVAPTEATVLIMGETGTGKGVVAKIIHDLSERKEGEFVTIDCASIPGELLESELFGHEKGAFTGAIQQKKGRIELSDNGTLFLDEIGDMPLNLQAKMLRFLQEKKFERVGGNKTLSMNARVIAATNKDIKKAVEDKRFREDLYYRLCGITLCIPPLRERGEDSFVLANSFLNDAREANNLKIKGFTSEARNIIIHYTWQGNVRQLKNVVLRAAILCNGEFISGEDLGLEPFSLTNAVTLKEARDASDKKLIRQQLLYNNGNQSKTARALDIDRGTLRDLMKKFSIEEINEA